MDKIARAAARDGSFDAAAASLADLAEVTISGRQVGRIAHEVGEQLRHDRDQRVEEFQSKRAKPESPVAPRSAVVEIDGGRSTPNPFRGARPGSRHPRPGVARGQGRRPAHDEHQSHHQGPHPDLPRCFTKKREVVELVQEISGQGALADVVEAGADEPPALTVFEPAEAGKAPEPLWPPELLVRTCVATLGSSEEFGPMVAAKAHRRNFVAAQSRVFLGDGGAWIWALQRTLFPTFEPVVDLVHVLAHVYLAAKAFGGPATAVWQRDLDWATACWQGRVSTVLEPLTATLAEMPPPPEGQEVKPTDPYEVIRLTIGYLTNNQPRMDYPRYRREGMPTCSGLVESLVKQFNRRVKGTEKFWYPTHAETILQLRAVYLSDDERLSKHMKSYPVSCFRRYETTKRRKAG